MSIPGRVLVQPVAPAPQALPGWADARVQPDDTTLPGGFRACGEDVEAGGPRVAAVWCVTPASTSAVRYTRNAVRGAPVTVSMTDADAGGVRAFLVHAQNANVGNGPTGEVEARRFRDEVVPHLGCGPADVVLAGTGIVGQPFSGQVPGGALARAVARGGDEAADRFAAAITTTDRWRKCATVRVTLADGRSYLLAGQAKGAGMIEPRFATLLVALETDAAVPAQVLDQVLGAALDESFNRVTVDGQLSTSDTCVVMASGAAEVTIDTPEDLAVFAEAMTILLRHLAYLVIADGEGARRIGEVTVDGSGSAAELVARQIARSPLVKAAMYGGDANFGRILQAAGQALSEAALTADTLSIDLWGVPVVEAGQVVAVSEADRRTLDEHAGGPAWRIHVGLGDAADVNRAVVLFSDLSHEYVGVNADYTS